MELVTVVVPVYEAERFLDRCVESIVKQTYKNIEVILVDDGSSDNSPNICEQWAERDSRVIVIHQNNSGVSVARNIGLSNANGQYVMMVDSDDYICSTMIERMCEVMKIQNVDMVICDFEKGNKDKYLFEYNQENEIKIMNPEMALKEIYKNDKSALQYVAPWAKLYKKVLFDGIMYPEGKIFEDIYVTHKLILKCQKIGVISQKMIYYYQHSESIMNCRFHVKKLDYLEALKERIEIYQQNNLEELRNIAYDEYLHSLIWEYSRARDILQNKEAIAKIKKSYHDAYVKGYASKRYPKENKFFLRIFDLNPEFIIMYWKITGKIMRKIKNGKTVS